MDLPAELTLQLVRLIHDQLHAKRPRGFDWFLVPAFRSATWEETRTRLVQAAKPLIVAPLPEPGYLGLWEPGSAPDAISASLKQHLANQLSFHTSKLSGFGYTGSDTLRLNGATWEFTLPVEAFLQWCRDYALAVGVSIGKSRDAGIGQLLVRPPGGGGPPLGGWDRVEEDHDHAH